MAAMKWLGENPFHTLLLLTEKPAEWSMGWLVPIELALAACAGLLWARVVADPALGWIVALGLVLYALADWALLAALPRWGLSFGAVQPPWLGLCALRWFWAVIACPFAARWPLPAVGMMEIGQALVWVLTVYGTVIEPFRLAVTELQVASPKLANPGIPLRIVQLSDLHVERLTRRDRALPELVKGLAPDIVMLTGDFLNTSYNDDPQAVSELEALLGQIHTPGGVYAIWGTPEVDLPDYLRPVFAGLGITLLEDQAVEVIRHGQRLWLIGLGCRRDLEAGGVYLRRLLAAAPAGVFALLLHHTPDLMPQAAALGVDLYLAGHTHGGQWRLPGFGALLTSSRYWKRYEAGAYRQGSTQLYVSRGLGLEGFGAPRARFFCRPEVVVITLTGVENGG